MSLPAGNVDGNTSAESEYPAATMIVTGVSVLRNLLKEGENVLAIELHRFLVNEDVNSFDASALLILDNMYMLKDGFGTTKPSATGDEGSDKLFDNNSSTKFSVAGCVGTEFMWEYANGRREAITNYGLVSGNDCNMRHPSGWKLSASNDGQTWVILHQTQRQYFSLYNEQKRYDMYNTEAYSMYKVEVTECNNEALDSQPCGEQSFQLADFYLFSKRIDRAYCAPEDDYPGALEGENSYKACPAYYEGMKFRTCTEGKFSEETDLCNVLAPASIVYPQEIYNFVAKKNVGRVVPTIARRGGARVLLPRAARWSEHRGVHRRHCWHADDGDGDEEADDHGGQQGRVCLHHGVDVCGGGTDQLGAHWNPYCCGRHCDRCHCRVDCDDEQEEERETQDGEELEGLQGGAQACSCEA